MSGPRAWADLEVRHLLALEAIREEGSFHRAAGRLDYTQSAISQQIQTLEAIVRARLIDRPGGSRPVCLTPAGELLLSHARSLLAQVQGAQTDLTALEKEGGRGTLRVGAFQSIGTHVLPTLVNRLSAELPKLDVDWTQTTSDPELYDRVAGGNLDVAFAMLPTPPGSFAVREVFAEPFVAIVAADSVLARRCRPLSLRALFELPLVAAKTCRSSGDLLAQARERGVDVNVVMRTDDNGTALGMVARGEVAALVPRLVAEGAGDGVAVLPLADESLQRRVALVWKESRHLFPLRDRFVELVIRVCADLALSGAPLIAVPHRSDAII